MEKITSRSNGLLVHMKKLAASAAYRREQGVYLCDSPKLLAEALKWHAPVREIAVTADVPLPPLPETVRAVEIPEDVMSSISPMKSPQGALFTVTLPETAVPEALPGSRYMVLDGVQDPGNVGTILRTLDAFDFDGLLLLEGCADPWSVKTVRSSMGAVFRRPVWCLKAAQRMFVPCRWIAAPSSSAARDRASATRCWPCARRPLRSPCRSGASP